MEILSVTSQHLVKMNDHVTVKLCREETFSGQSEYYISQVLCYPDFQIEPISVMSVPIHLGEWGNEDLLWVIQKKMTPVVKRLLKDCFGIFLEEDTEAETPEEKE